MKRSIFLMIFLGSFFTVLGQTEYPVTQPTQKINESPWYGLGLSNSTFSGASGSAVQLAGYYGLLFKTGNGQFSFLQNGNVGIGTTDPKTKLQVAGDFSSGYNNVLSLDNNEWFNFGNISGHGYINWFSKANADKSGFINTHSSQKASSIRGGFGEIEFFTSSINNGIGQPSGLVERMVINSDGNVGVGIENPSQKFEIYNSNLFNTTDALTNQDHITLSSVNGGLNSYFGGITWRTGSRRRAAIAAVQEHEDADHIGLAFFTKGTDGPGPFYESMRISRGGNVGIGTANPSHNMDISNNSTLRNVGVELDASHYTGTGTSYSYIQFRTPNYKTDNVLTDGAAEIGLSNANGNLYITRKTNVGSNSHGIVLDKNANVGIGTTDPTTKLHVFNGNNSYGAILANATERAFSLYTKTITTDPNTETFRLGLKYNTDENNGFISFYRGADTYGGYLGFSTNGTERLKIDASGSVGIGATNPEGNLQIGSSTQNGMVFLGGGKGYSGIGSTRSDGGLALGWNIYARYDDESDNWKARVAETGYRGYSGIKITHRGVIDFFGHNGSVTEDEIANTDERVRMRINESGNVGIGTINPDAKLAVNGTIHTKEVKVDLQGWPDYVFAKEYKLLSLEEVSKYIKENGHLPKMPSAKEVEKNGVLLGEMNKKLLEKIEELTLYTIEQEKEIKKLRNQEERIDKLEQENKQLKNLLDRVSKLEKQLERK